MDEIPRSNNAFRVPKFCQRRLLIELAVLFQRQLECERVLSNEDTKRRKRARWNGEFSQPLRRGTSDPNKVLVRITAETPAKIEVSQKQRRARLGERIDIGLTLSTIVWEWRHSNPWRRNEADGCSIEGALASGYIHKYAK
jgi:hypothetical protein